MTEETSLEFELLINPEKRRVVLKGDLEEKGDLLEVARMLFVFQEASNLLNFTGGRWTVDASNARMVPEGVERWKLATREYFSSCFFDYMDDQLGCILKYDDVYRAAHPQDTFHEDA